ncbi:integrase, catalytic region, zinc finger, CCHC-type containing protein [Tanacetum coccineum]
MLTKPQVFYDNNLKQALGFQNPFYLKKAQQIRPMLYDGSVIAKETNVISIVDSEETLMLEEESRSKMLLKQSDPMVLEKKVNIKPINYAELNRLSKDFGKRFVPQQELSNEQAFRLQTLHPNTDQSASSPEKVFVITALKNDLRKFKGKDIVDNAAQVSNATTIAPGMYKLDLVTLAPKDKNNRETHIYYLKHTIEQAAILREIVKQAKSLNPLDSASYSACKYVKLIQELLGYVRDTCPDIHKPSEKLVVVTPINKKKTVSRSTKSSRSKSTDNTKNDRILQISSSTQKKNKVEDHSRIVKSCLNKSNCVVEPSENTNVQHSNLNTNFEQIRVKCNSFMFDARHELYLIEFVSDMNASSKTKSVKKARKKEEWKPIGKVFTKIGYNWRPTGRTFTLVENACPLTRITATNKVHLREPIPLEVIVQESVVTRFILGELRDPILQLLYLLLLLSISDLKVAFRKHTCFVRNLEGVDLLSGSRETNLYTLLIVDMMASFPIFLLSYDDVFSNLSLVQSLKDQIMFTWVKFLASKDEAPDFIIKFLKMIQIRLNTPIRNIPIDNGTEFVNQTLCSYYESVGISYETSVTRSPQQNTVIETRNHTLVEAA